MWQPYLRVIGVQLMSTGMLTLAAAWFFGFHGAVSVVLGGLVGAIGALVFAFMAVRPERPGQDATEVVLRALRAQALKLVSMGALLWLVLANYQEAMVVGVVGSFILSVLVFQFALFLHLK